MFYSFLFVLRSVQYCDIDLCTRLRASSSFSCLPSWAAFAINALYSLYQDNPGCQIFLQVIHSLLPDAWSLALYSFFFRMILRIILNWQLLAGPIWKPWDTSTLGSWELVQQIMISHYATRGLEDAIYLVSSGAYSVFLHPCSSVYSHSQQWLIPDPLSRYMYSREPVTMDQGSVALNGSLPEC